MRILLQVLAAPLLLPFLLGTELPTLNGVFVPDVDLTMNWMEKANHPAVQGENGVQRFREAAYSSNPLIHQWNKGKLTILISEDWSQPTSYNWVQLDKATWQFVIPPDESNTKTIHVLKILSNDLYFLDLTVNDRVTREYFRRRKNNE